MKKLFLTTILILNQTLVFAQTKTQTATNTATDTCTETTVDGVKVGISGGPGGGSFYNVPSDHQLAKYGSERSSPTGLSFAGTLDSDKLGNIYFRKLSMDRAEDKTLLGKQTLFVYDAPQVKLGEKKNMDLFVKGKMAYYSQKDHLLYFKVDEKHTPNLDQELKLEDQARTKQHQTLVAPEVGGCYQVDKSLKAFDFTGKAQVALAPVALMEYKTKVTENNIPNVDLTRLDKSGKTFAFGGELVVEGIAKYKDKYYFKARILQNHYQGTNKDKVSSTNRIGHYELGYLINKNLSVNMSVQNNELITKDKDRTAIEVYNLVGAGLNYTLPTTGKKKPRAPAGVTN